MLYKRGGVWTWRRAVPAALRSIIGKREVVRSLRTSDVQVARSRAITIAAETDAAFWRARRTLANPENAVSAVASKIVREDAAWRRGRLLDDEEIEAQQLGILDELDRLTEKAKATKPSDEIEHQGRIRALRTILAKLEAGDNAADAAPDQDDVTFLASSTVTGMSGSRQRKCGASSIWCSDTASRCLAISTCGASPRATFGASKRIC